MSREWMAAIVLTGALLVGTGLYFLFRKKPSVAKAPAKPNQSPEGFLILAGDALRDKRLSQAREFAESGIRLRPETPRTRSSLLNIMGNVAAEMKSYDQARKYFLEAVNADPGFAFPHNNLGNLYFMQKEYDQAMKEYQTALKLKPDYADAQSNLTRLNRVRNG